MIKVEEKKSKLLINIIRIIKKSFAVKEKRMTTNSNRNKNKHIKDNNIDK